MFAIIALWVSLIGAMQEPYQPEEPGATAEAIAQPAAEEHEFDILHHIMDAREIAIPGFGYVQLPPAGSWMLGPLDITPTKHVVFLWLTAVVVLLLLIPAAMMAKRSRGERGAPRGRRHNAIEAAVLFLRDQVVMPNIGHGGERYAPFVITLFFFILVANLLGLLPYYGATATGNVSVTAALALLSLIVIEVAGMQALGFKGYIGTIVYVPHGLPKWLVPIMAIIMTPVELLGKIAKPFALTMRLFANMVAGHVLLLAIIGLIFVFGSWYIAAAPAVMAVALTFLEIFVAFLQAYVFALLTSVFIGLIRHAH